MEGGCRYLLHLTPALTLSCLPGTPGTDVQLCVHQTQKWSMTRFPPSRNLLEAPAPGAVQGAHSSPASPQPQDPGCADRAPLPVSGPPPRWVPWSSWGSQGQLAVWGLPTAQGMLAPITAGVLGCAGALLWDISDVPKVIPQQGGVTGGLGVGDICPVGHKLHPVPKKERRNQIPIPNSECEVGLFSDLMAAGSPGNRNCLA